MSLVAKDPVSLTQALIRCESVTPHEGGALSLLEAVLSDHGFTCHRMTFSDRDTPDVQNLYARIGTEGPNLCFAGHTDVVPPGDVTAWSVPPFSGEIRDGKVYGRGAVDMKGGVACFVAAALAYLEAKGGKPKGSISLLITGDEEGPSINGTMKVLEWLAARGETLDACIVGEPSNPDTIGDEMKIGRRGSLTCELVVHGKQGHSAYPQKADNPVPKLARIIDRMSTVEIDQGTEHFERSNLQVTVISVPNRASNVIPGEARAIFNVRYNDLWRRPTIETWVRAACQEAAESVGASFTLSFAGTGDVFLTEKGPLVETMSDAVHAMAGRRPKLTTGGGTSDARFIKDACPVVEFGLVNRTIHAVDEHVPIADLELLTAIYGDAIRRFFDRAP